MEKKKKSQNDNSKREHFCLCFHEKNILTIETSVCVRVSCLFLLVFFVEYATHFQAQSLSLGNNCIRTPSPLFFVKNKLFFCLLLFLVFVVFFSSSPLFSLFAALTMVWQFSGCGAFFVVCWVWSICLFGRAIQNKRVNVSTVKI